MLSWYHAIELILDEKNHDSYDRCLERIESIIRQGHYHEKVRKLMEIIRDRFASNKRFNDKLTNLLQ